MGLLRAQVSRLGMCIWLLFHKFKVGGLCRYVNLAATYALVLYAVD